MIFQDRIYGKIEVTEPVILELINTPQFERLKKIHANGIYFYFYPGVNVTKYEHSLGVWHLLKKFGASLEEQVAGLLHDVSHKVFAHVIDYFYGSHLKEDYQDNIHLEVLQSKAISDILTKHYFNLEEIGNFSHWPLLDNELPNLCSDRLDYTLRDSFQINFSDQALIDEVLADLTANEHGLVFQNLATAKKFGDLSLKMNNDFWHTDWGNQAFELMADILKYALSKNILTLDDFWSNDKEILEKLISINEPWINKKLSDIKNIRQLPISGTADDYDVVFPFKFRAIDPWIKDRRLSQLDLDFKNQFEKLRARAKTGHYLKLSYEK